MPDENFAPERGYEIVRLLGRGGTALVYLAKQTATNRLCALKTSLTENRDTTKEFRQLIEREFYLTGALKYPGLVPLYDLHVEENKASFLSMEYCPGPTLDKIGRIKSPKLLLNILSSISINLYYLKLNGIFHGDLKPQNIFCDNNLTDSANKGNNLFYTRLADFSLGLRSDEKLSDRLGLGTIGYAAPEVTDKTSADHLSDIFSLGVIGYLLATGQHPFMHNETDPVRINSRIKEVRPTAPHEFDWTIPVALSELIMQMLDREPNDRPPDCYQICQKLEKAGASYPFRKAIRPKHLMTSFGNKSVTQYLEQRFFDIDMNFTERLLDYAGHDKNLMRHLLEVNFTTGKLGWSGGRMIFRCDIENIVWPRKLKKIIKRQFAALPYPVRKKAVLSAVIGNLENAKTIGILNGTEDSAISRPMIYCLQQRLSQFTICRLSRMLAKRALLVAKNKLLAARLFLKSGNLDSAYNITLDTANELIGSNDYQQAVELLISLEQLCRENKDIKRQRIVLMRLADAKKTLGEIGEAEMYYQKISGSYKENESDQVLAETYKDLGDLYKIKHNYEEGIGYLRKAENIYLKLGDELELSHTLNNIGNILLIVSRLDEALISFRRTLKIQRRLEVAQDIASTLNNMAAVYYYKGRYERTLRLFNLAVRLQREIGHAGELARTLNNLGCVYHDTGDFSLALEKLEESISLNRRIGSKKELLFNLENFSNVLLSAGRLKESLVYLKEGLNLSRELSDKPHTAFFVCAMARSQKRMGFYGQALDNINRALVFHEEINDNQHFLICLLEQADILIRLNEYKTAARLIEKIRVKAEELDDKKALISGLLLEGRLSGNLEPIDRALQLSQHGQLNRLFNIAVLEKIKILQSQSENIVLNDYFEKLSGIFREGYPDIETPRFFNLLARHNLAQNKREKSEIYYQKALSLAKKSALLPEMIDSTIYLGRINSEAGEREKAFEYYKNAFKYFKAMSDDITDESLKKAFLTDDRILILSKEINALNKVLNFR